MKKKAISKMRYSKELLNEMRRYIEDPENYHDFKLIVAALGYQIFGNGIFKKLPKEDKNEDRTVNPEKLS